MKQYLDLLNNIIEKGTLKPAAREGMPSTTSLFGYQFRHDLKNGFPLLTTKKMYWKAVVVELLHFLKGETTINFLHEHNIKIWDEDCEKYDSIEKKHLGKIYGHQWRNYGGKLKSTYKDKKPFNIKVNQLQINNSYSIYKSNNYGEYIILEEIKKNDRNKYNKIQFILTGYISDFIIEGYVPYPAIKAKLSTGLK